MIFGCAGVQRACRNHGENQRSPPLPDTFLPSFPFPFQEKKKRTLCCITVWKTSTKLSQVIYLMSGSITDWQKPPVLSVAGYADRYLSTTRTIKESLDLVGLFRSFVWREKKKSSAEQVSLPFFFFHPVQRSRSGKDCTKHQQTQCFSVYKL